jgi:hypothetical protein
MILRHQDPVTSTTLFLMKGPKSAWAQQLPTQPAKFESIMPHGWPRGTFFSDADYALYHELLTEYCQAAGVAVWAWCLMPNHVHLTRCRMTPMGCAGRLRHCTAATLASSMPGTNAPVISGRAGSAASP